MYLTGVLIKQEAWEFVALIDRTLSKVVSHRAVLYAVAGRIWHSFFSFFFLKHFTYVELATTVRCI